MPEPPLPQPFGPFVLRERLGGSTISEAFLATRASPGAVQRPIVVHRFLAPHGQDQRFGAMLAAELRAVSELAHPGIVRLHDAGAIDACWFLVTDYVDGLDLAQWLVRLAAEQRPLPVGLACHIAAELAAALAHAHSHAAPDGTPQGVVHGAVRTDRVLISKAGEVLLTEFGVAAAFDRYQSEPEPARQAPRGPRLDTSSDLLAIVAILKALLPANPAEIPEQLQLVLERSTHAAAYDRYENARALRKALLVAARAAGLEGDREALADFLHVPPTTELKALPLRPPKVELQGDLAVVPVAIPAPVAVAVPAAVPAPVAVPADDPVQALATPADQILTVAADLSPSRPSQRLPIPVNPLPRPRPSVTLQPPRTKTPVPQAEARTRFLDALPDEPAPHRPTPRPRSAPLPARVDPDDAPASWRLVAVAAAVWVGALVVGVYAMLLTLAS